MRLLIPLLLAAVQTAPAVQVRREPVEGIRNFSQVGPTVACGGSTEPAAMPELARRGFRAVVNLRLETEAGARIEESRAAAERAGLRYLHLPFNGAEPDMAVADAFIKAMTDEANLPVFVHCGSANRVGALWMAKRMLVDRWPADRAEEEARAIGLSSDALLTFVRAYVATRGGA